MGGYKSFNDDILAVELGWVGKVYVKMSKRRGSVLRILVSLWGFNRMVFSVWVYVLNTLLIE